MELSPVSRLAAIVENSHDAIVAKDLNGIVTAWNSSAERIFGYTAEEMIGNNIAVLAAPDRAEEMPTVLARLSRGETIEPFETVRRHKSGRLIEISLTVSPIRDNNGAICGASKIARDITYQKSIERRLMETAASFRAAFEQAAVGMAHVSRQGRWMRVNKHLCTLLQTSPSALLGGSIFDIIEGEDFRAAFADFAQPGAPAASRLHIEAGCRRVGGSLTRMEIAGSQLVELNAGLDCLSFTMNDVTQRWEAQAALREEERRLQALQKMEVIGRLSAGVAHDFNNILQSVNGTLEVLLDELPKDSDLHNLADAAHASAKRGAMLTHYLLSYARKQTLVPQEVDLAAFFTQFERLLGRTLGSHIRIIVALAPDLPPLKVDSAQLQTALLNLAINASHAMPEGGNLGFFATASLEDGGAFVTIKVNDTGVGMDAETLARAFEPFFTTKGNAGTGLGLSMVHGFACQSGGRATIESQVGKGTAISLVLPAVSHPPAASARPAAPKRILLVEDTSDTCLIVSAFLRREDYEVVCAENGQDALTLAAAGERFSLLITDYGLPDTTGVHLIADLRCLQPGLPAVLITGYLALDRGSALPEGVTKLTKPFGKKPLLEAVAAAMEGAERPIVNTAEQVKSVVC